MKNFAIIGILGLVFLFVSCDNNSSSSPQLYDMFEFIVSASGWAAIQAEFDGDDEPTRENLNELRTWIVLNASPQAYVLRGMTRSQITNLLLDITTLTRPQIDTLFQDTNRIGKAVFILQLPGNRWGIYFIEKL